MAAPACRIAVFIILLAVEQPFLDQVISNLLSYIGRALSCEPVVAREVDPKLIYRRYNSQVKFFAEAKVLAPTARSDMYDACTFGGAYLFPRHNSVYDALFSGQFVKGTTIAPAHHIAPFKRLYNMIVAFVVPLKRF